MFYVGQKVVCVEADVSDSWLSVYPGFKMPEKGSVYTIREIVPEDEGGCNLMEITNPPHPLYGREFGYQLWRFRPVTDISDLQTIVAEVKRGKPRKIKADQFDRERAPQARDAAPDHRPAAASLPAAPVSPSPAVEPPASFLDTARKAIEGGQ